MSNPAGWGFNVPPPSSLAGLGRQGQQQGRQANRNGAFWEKDLIHRLTLSGYQQWESPPSLLPEPFFVHQYQSDFRNLYNERMLLDIYLRHPDIHPYGLIIEGKYQEANGSVDEKYPFLIQSLKKTGIPAILMLLGGGARRSAIQYCLDQQNDYLHVMTSWDEWTRWLNRGLL